VQEEEEDIYYLARHWTRRTTSMWFSSWYLSRRCAFIDSRYSENIFRQKWIRAFL